MHKDFLDFATALKDDLKAIRHHLHRFPELSFQEVKTMNFIAEQLTKIGIPFEKEVAKTGIVALIKGGKDGGCIALRADMDALPIKEENNTDYKSQHEGLMHACGHDVHTACLLGAAKILWNNKSSLSGTVKLIFQPGEEMSPGGASLMIKAGALENPKPEAILGLHVFPDLPTGSFGFKSGQYMASADEIHITIIGKGGHAALPQNTIDPIVIAANIIVQIQQLVSRRSHPLTPTVLSFGHINGGHTTNVIPDTVTIKGTLRTFDEVWRKEAILLIKKIVEDNAAIWGARAVVDIPPGYPSLYNNEALCSKVESSARQLVGDQNVYDIPMRMTAEDFSFYTHEIPGCFFRLGTNKENKEFLSPVHNSRFDINEDALVYGAAMMAWTAFSYLSP